MTFDLERWHPAAGRWPPVAAALLLGAIAAAESWLYAARTATPETHRPLLIAILVLLGLASTAPVAVATTWPAPVAGLVTGVLLVSIVAAETLTYAGVVAQLVTGYLLGGRGPGSVGPASAGLPEAVVNRGFGGFGSRPSRLWALILAAPFPLLAVIALTGSVTTARQLTGTATVPPVNVVGFVVPLALLAVLAPIAALAGIAHRSAREAAAGRTATAAIADSLLEHTARGERARIARELHDVVAHHISMVAIQAETARLTTPGMPEAGARRLRDIGDTARSALTEMRRLLGVLREDTGADPAALTPQPGLRLRELNALVDSARDASGTSARLILSGRPLALDPGVELAAHRVIQEALTNARRHAPGSGVDVRLDYTPAELVVDIRDNGPGPNAAPAGPDRRAHHDSFLTSGHGLTGMRERAAAVGGRLVVGAAPGGGFLVELRLPITDAAAT